MPSPPALPKMTLSVIPLRLLSREYAGAVTPRFDAVALMQHVSVDEGRACMVEDDARSAPVFHRAGPTSEFVSAV